MKSLFRAVFVVLVALLLVPTIASGAEPASGAAHVLNWTSAVVDIVTAVVVALLPLAFAWLASKVAKSEAQKEAVQLLKTGVEEVYQTFVKKLKAALADGSGKLSEAEKQKARDMAIAKAKELAKPAARKVLEAWGKPVLEALVSRIVNRNKSGR